MSEDLKAAMDGNNERSIKDLFSTLNEHRERLTAQQMQQLIDMAADVEYRATPPSKLVKQYRTRHAAGVEAAATREPISSN